MSSRIWSGKYEGTRHEQEIGRIAYDFGEGLYSPAFGSDIGIEELSDYLGISCSYISMLSKIISGRRSLNT